ncbi:hypothetical protein SAMN04489724_3017 [Algoriphagus locisalis]|uniref:GTPase-associated system helical domain-containing protein n=1 Tax=Algoriphagus locisalis TaxID=305507 RepID=A0A1I7CAT2_9BACT|nr:GTPase-associated system all-helical protein GASH [Algoriphagus locisalis]SFT96507.1 hypothetical protein SAMN04489724_3017 [Algoriphagus locisalis]
MLQKFQDEILNLTETDHLDKLKKAAAEIEKKLARDKRKIVPFLLAGMDPQVPIDNPEITEAKEIIAKKWTTFSGVAKDSPVTYIRAAIIHAIDSLASDQEIANLCVLASKNIISHLKLTSGDEKVVGGFIQKLSDQVNGLANMNFAANYVGHQLPPSAVVAPLKRFKIEEKPLGKSLEAASGPKDSAGTAIPNANPKTPDEEGWSQGFAPKAAKAIGDAVNKLIEAQVGDFEQTIQGLKQTSNPFINIDVIQLKTELLWWKFAGYSTSFEKRYREMPKGILEFALALDYGSNIPSIFPIAVRYFLLDTHRELCSNPEDQISVLDFAKLLVSYKSDISDKIGDCEESPGRTTFYDFIRRVVNGSLSLDDFESIVGMSSNDTMSYGDLCVWLFEDMQCELIINK